MTGNDLINLIQKHNLQNCDILGSDEDGIKFSTDDTDVDYSFLWLRNDYYQDVIFCKEGELTYGID